jgi:hypothetical protein
MRPILPFRAGAPRAVRALVLLATLFLGAAVHELHHALEPHESGAHSAEHACGCSTMHAAALVAEAQDVPAPAPCVRPAAAPASSAAPVALAPALAAPRAPPAA